MLRVTSTHSWRYLRNLLAKRSRGLAFLACLALAGCADGAKFLQETDQGGIVIYPYKGEQGSLVSSFRRDALTLMEQKCHGSYSIVREGETKGRTRVAGSVQGSQEMVQEHRWGIQFQCK
jgi:hypothetical protein